MKRTEKTEIVGHVSCPNCHAQADVIALKRQAGSLWWEILCRCSKCKGQWPYVEHIRLDFGDCTVNGNCGPLMHDIHKRIADARRDLHERWQKATTPAQRGRIMAAVKKLAEEEKEWIASL